MNGGSKASQIEDNCLFFLLLNFELLGKWGVNVYYRNIYSYRLDSYSVLPYLNSELQYGTTAVPFQYRQQWWYFLISYIRKPNNFYRFVLCKFKPISKFNSVPSHTCVLGMESITPHILIFDIRWSLAVGFTTPTAWNLRRKRHKCHWKSCWLDPRASLNILENTNLLLLKGESPISWCLRP